MGAVRRQQMQSDAEAIAAQLRERILGGGYPLGAPLPSERELVQQFGTTRWMVRRAIQILEVDHLIARKRGKGNFVASVSETGALAELRTGLIGLLVWEVEYGRARLVQGACDAAARIGYSVSVSSVHNQREEAQALRAFVRNNMLGVVMSCRSSAAPGYLEQLLQDNAVVVFFDTVIEGRDEDHVLSDDARGTQLATEHLIKLGHRRLAYLSHNRWTINRIKSQSPPDSDFPTGRDRYRGFIDECAAQEIAVPADFLIQTDEEHYREPLLKLLDRPDRPTGVVAYNDLWAIRTIRVARSLGLEVPRDLSVVGFDDSTLAPDYDVPLTTINPERYDMGYSAVEMLIAKLERRQPRPPHGLRITPRLVIRQSTGQPPSDSTNAR